MTNLPSGAKTTLSVFGRKGVSVFHSNKSIKKGSERSHTADMQVKLAYATFLKGNNMLQMY